MFCQRHIPELEMQWLTIKTTVFCRFSSLVECGCCREKTRLSTAEKNPNWNWVSIIGTRWFSKFQPVPTSSNRFQFFIQVFQLFTYKHHIVTLILYAQTIHMLMAILYGTYEHFFLSAVQGINCLIHERNGYNLTIYQFHVR